MEGELIDVRNLINRLGKRFSLCEYIAFVDEIACHCIALSGRASGNAGSLTERLQVQVGSSPDRLDGKNDAVLEPQCHFPAST